MSISTSKRALAAAATTLVFLNAISVARADIKAGTPDTALALLQQLQAANTAPAEDIAILSHRIAASYLAEGQDAQAYQLAAGVANTNACPQLEWDAGFSAYRLGHWADATAHLEKLAQNGSVMGSLRAQAAFWAARAHMQSGDPLKVVTLLNFAAGKEPSFYGLIAERMLGIDTQSGFADAIVNQDDFRDLMAVPAAHRAVGPSPFFPIRRDEPQRAELSSAARTSAMSSSVSSRPTA